MVVILKACINCYKIIDCSEQKNCRVKKCLDPKHNPLIMMCGKRNATYTIDYELCDDCKS
jgi:hypothetical protein